MSECHVETFLDATARWRRALCAWRAQVVQTDTGRALYTTWPYETELSALRAARRWIQRQRANEGRCGGPLYAEDAQT